MPEFDNNGASVHYELLGAGPPLLLIAGIASDGASWAPLAPLLADRFRLILIDNRGSGRTRAPLPLSLRDMAEDCAVLLERLRIETADVVAHSMGGAIARQLAAAHPSRVRRLVSMTSADRLPRKEAELMTDLATLYHELEPTRWFRLLYQWLFSEPFFADAKTLRQATIASALYPFRQSPENFSAQVAAVLAHEPPALGLIRCPVLAVAAERDILVPPAAVRAVHEAIPDCRFEFIPGAAHSVHWEQPEAVATAIAAFLNQLPLPPHRH
jgi:aminoacrylate hydrolase